MLGVIIFLLIALWVLGYVSISGLNIPDLTLFVINGHPITMISLLILFVVAWAISMLPTPLQIVAGILLLLWILSVLGLFSLLSVAALGGSASLMVLLIIVVIAFSFVL